MNWPEEECFTEMDARFAVDSLFVRTYGGGGGEGERHAQRRETREEGGIKEGPTGEGVGQVGRNNRLLNRSAHRRQRRSGRFRVGALE